MTESEILQYKESQKKKDEKFRKAIAEHSLEHGAYYWIKGKSKEDGWAFSQCSIGIESSHLYGNAGLIYTIDFYVIGDERSDDYEDIILGPKIEIGEPPQ